MIEQSHTAPTSKKAILYERADGRCQFPPGCDVTNLNLLTVDHKTSKRDARQLGWPAEKMDDLSNLQLLCVPHHNLKDNPPARIRQLLLKTDKPWFELVESVLA